jgi:flavodoxin I
MMGYTSQDGYEHEASKAIRGDLFCGLLCDEVNQDDLTASRVEKWVDQLKQEGILDGASVAIREEIPSSVDVVSVTPEIPSDGMRALEEENAKLRAMLEDNSKLLDRVLQQESDGISLGQSDFTPHYNANTKVTMWTSSDGRSCYYTNGSPSSP